MTPSQAKSIYETITENELDWTLFIEDKTSSDENESNVTRIIHSPTGLYFQFSYSDAYENLDIGPWGVVHTPGKDFRPKDSHLAFIKSWNQVISFLKSWLKILKQEIIAQAFIDRMLTYKIDLKDFSKQTGVVDELFTEEEKKIIIGQLNTFKDETNKLSFPKHEIEEINQKIDYLIDRLEKNYSKVDWTNIFVSIILSTMVTEGLEIVKSPLFVDKIKSLFHIITGGYFLLN